jgi:hypothetical protein
VVSVRRAAAAVVLAAVLASPGRAAAQPRAAADAARADALFRDGKRLMAEGRFGEACPMLAESQRLDPGGGTLYNLALCHDREGRTATAWAELGEALELAKSAHRPDAESAVRAHLRDLERRLSRLRVRVDDAAAGLADLAIEVDGRPWPRAAWNQETPLDPGHHDVAARASSRAPFAAGVELGAAADRRDVVVRLAPLAAAPVAPIPPAPPAAPKPPPPEPVAPLAPRAPPAPPPSQGRSAGPWILGGVGVAGLAAGAVLGGLAMSRWGDAKARCPARECTDPAGVDASRAATNLATGSTVAFGVGVAGAAAALGWLWLAPKPAPTQPAGSGARVVPFASASGGGALVRASW